MNSAIATAVVPPGQIGEALAYALSELPADERDATCADLLQGQQAGRGRIVVVEAQSQGQRVGAIAAWILPGHIATTWPSRVNWREIEPVRAALALGLQQTLVAAGIEHAQALISADEGPAGASLVAVGFAWTADLLYMLCRAESFPRVARELPFLLVPKASEQVERLGVLVDATYQGTLDCPALNGLRSTADVLASYRSSGEFNPAWWFLAVHDGQDVGCLILADYPQANQIELVYFGVIPRARGQGWGELLVRHALEVAKSVGRQQVVLAVDARNQPAIKLYLRCGFEECTRRSVWLKTV